MKTLLAIAAAAAMAATTFVAATPATADYNSWYCYAASPQAYGWARDYSRRAAVHRALWECACRTQRGDDCRIRYCR